MRAGIRQIDSTDLYGRTCGVIRDNPLVDRPVEEMEGARELSRSRARRCLSSAEALMTGSKYCVSGISAVGGRRLLMSHAMGGGVEISLACDVRFAAAGVKLGLTEARIGAMPGATPAAAHRNGARAGDDVHC